MTLPGDGTPSDPYAQSPGPEATGVPVPPAASDVPQAVQGGIESSAYGDPYADPYAPSSADPYAPPSTAPGGPSAYASAYAPSAGPYGASYAAQPDAYSSAPYGQPASADGYAAAQHPYAQYPYPPYAPYLQPSGRKLSLTGMLLSIGGVVGMIVPVLNYFSWAAAIAGIVLGFVAKGKEPEQKGMWLTAIIVGFAYFVLSAILVVFAIVVFLLSGRG